MDTPGTDVQPSAFGEGPSAGTASRRSGRVATVTASPWPGVAAASVTRPRMVSPPSVRTVAMRFAESNSAMVPGRKLELPMKSATKRLTGCS